MAVPDPHVNELDLMSYEPRPRACKDLYKVPRKGDYIEVLWCLDNLPGMPNRWCPAEVLHVLGDPDQDCLATGVIRYLPGDTWGQQFDFVDFMDRHKLRCSANDDEDETEVPSENIMSENPCLEWRFTAEDVIRTDQSESDPEDDNWFTGKSDAVASKKRRAQISFQNERGGASHNTVEINALREGHAALVVEVEKMKRELVTVSQHLASLHNTDHRLAKCTSAACVLPRLRQKLALRMQGSLRQASPPARKRKNDEPDQDLSIWYVDGIHPGLLKARVECTLRQFESVSRNIRARSCSDSVYFLPDFSHTQLPLQCSMEFRILFKTFSHLCDMIGITSSSDKKEMARKCGKGPKGELIRFLRTYCYDKEAEHSSAHFFPGTSCGISPPRMFEISETNAESSTVASDKEDPLFPILSRRTREWDRVDGRYRHKLRKKRVPLPGLTDSCPDIKAFAMVWKRAAELGGRAWSQALCESGEVFGWLEICLPFVQTVGKQRCQELGGVGSDDMWDELLLIKPPQNI